MISDLKLLEFVNRFQRFGVICRDAPSAAVTPL